MENKNSTMNNEEVETGIVSGTLENDYTPRISDTLGYSKEYLEAMQNNYPYMTMEEIIGAIEEQKDYGVCFYHKHEGITEDLIKKYLIIDINNDIDETKITLETPEIHDCNLVELTPELQEKSYWGYRPNREVVSHLIDRKDYPGENKTNKLTIIGRRYHDRYYDENIGESVEDEYFYVITAFRGDGSAKREPFRHYGLFYDFDEMEYWMNHALIPENGEEIIRKANPPYWVTDYYERKKEKS